MPSHERQVKPRLVLQVLLEQTGGSFTGMFSGDVEDPSIIVDDCVEPERSAVVEVGLSAADTECRNSSVFYVNRIPIGQVIRLIEP